MKSENIEFLKQDYIKSNFFQEKFVKDLKLVETSGINELTKIFLKKVKDDLNIDCDISQIGSLHNKVENKLKEYDQNYGLSEITKVFAEMPKNFNKQCVLILKETIREEIGEDFFFQIQPTLRIQMPHHSSNSFYPVYHSDIQNGHPPYMINIWLPLNPPSELEGHGFNIATLDESIKIFKKYNYDIYQIQNDHKKFKYLDNYSETQKFKYGKSIMFDPRKMHSTMPLKDHVRVSVDMRIVPVELFKKFNRKYKSIFGRRESVFEPGGYYQADSIDNYKI